jgi:hypothetical protein
MDCWPPPGDAGRVTPNHSLSPRPEPQDPPTRIARGLLPAALIDEARDTLAELVGVAGGNAGAGDGDLDAAVSALAARERPRLGLVYDVFRDTEVFRRLVSAEPLLAAARRMVGAQRLISPFQHAVFRMDLAAEDWRGFGWHQDFPYNMLCARSLTAWIPLTAAGAGNGGVQVADLPDERLYPVEVSAKRDAQGRPLGGRDAFIAERFHPAFEACAWTPELAPGDALLFRSTVVHRSGRNPGPRHRYSIQVRFGALFAPELAARGWRHRHADGFDSFAQLHPELVAFKEDG